LYLELGNPMTQATATSHFQCPALVLTLTTKEIVGDEIAEELREQLMTVAAHARAQNVILDFQHVKYLSSAGFRPLLSLHKQLRQGGGRLIFCQLTEVVHEIFEVTRLISTKGSTPAPFDVFATVSAAIDSIK
jgi:anti-anti-sigma factor